MRRRRLPEIRLALMLLTRLPVGQFAGTPPEITHARWAFPLVGLPLALIAWAVLAGAAALGLSPLVGGVLAVTALVLATGGLHHDGLADFADGMGGRDPEQRLAIMRDSRVGSYGVLALILAVVLVADDAITEAQTALWQSHRLLVEPAGATALAALRSGAYVPEPGERVAVLVCGGNIAPDPLA